MLPCTRPMDCLDENQVVDYLQRRLPPSLRIDAEEHLDHCEVCRALVAATVKAETGWHVTSDADAPTAPTANDAWAESVESADPRFAPGALIDHFEVVRRIGSGGMGDIYLCRDARLGRRVALKTIRPAAVGGAQALRRFVEEARATARFNHPNIVTIYAVGQLEDVPYLALEYLEGQTLRERITQGQISVGEALRVSLAVADAMVEAHAHGVLHRDLKPSNVIIPPDGRPRVLDFGLAKRTAAQALMGRIEPPVEGLLISEPEVTAITGGSSLSGTRGVVCGTPAYMAPEQWLAAEVGPPCDVWALGVMLYEMLCSHRPYADAGSPDELRALVLDPAAVPPVNALEPLPEGVAPLVASCLDKQPGTRPTAAEARAALARVLDGGHALSAEECPFRGLLPFTERYAPLFFGREAEVQAFVERARQQAVLPVVGPSGAGKSSFVAAGALPRLREQAAWLVLRLRPGDRPFETLAARLDAARERFSRSRSARHELAPTLASPGRRGAADLAISDPLLTSNALPRASASDLARRLRDEPAALNLALRELADHTRSRVLLFVDQLEEVATLVEQEPVRRAFLDALCMAAEDPSDPVRVIFTLRDDYLGRLALTSRARQALASLTILQQPDPAALEATLTLPVTAVGYRYEDPELPREMIEELGESTSALPLLQFAAQQLWERRDRESRQLTRAAYEDLGGVRGALARQADTLLEGLSSQQMSLARRLLLALVTAEGTRRAVLRERLLDGLSDDAEAVLDRLIAGRLLVPRREVGRADDASAGDPAVLIELAHESLIASWRRLARWIDESSEDLVFLAEAEQAARLWQSRGRRPAELWRGEALVEAAAKLDRCRVEVPELVGRFLAAAEAEQGREHRRRRRRLAGLIGGLAVVAVAALVAAGVIARQKQQVEARGKEAQRQRAAALDRQAEAELGGARAAWARERHLEARARVRASLEAGDSAAARIFWRRVASEPVQWIRRPGGHIYQVAFSPADEQIACASGDRAVILIDRRSTATRRLPHKDQVLAVAYSRDGRWLAASDASGALLLHAVKDDARTTPRLLRARGRMITALTFAANGELAAGSGDGVVHIWQTPAGPGRPRRHVASARAISAVAFSPDNKRLATADASGRVRLWSIDAGQLKPLMETSGHKRPVHTLAFRRQGDLLASAGISGTIRLWDGRSGAARGTLPGHFAPVRFIAFSLDGERLVSASHDRTVRLWRVPEGRLLLTLARHDGEVTSAALSHDGRLLAISAGPTVKLRGLAAARPATGHRGVVDGISFSPDGRVLASGSWDRSVRTWDVASGEQRLVLRGAHGEVQQVRFSPGGSRIIAANNDGVLRLWNLARQAVTSRLVGHKGNVHAVAFTPDGRRLVSGGADGALRLWRASDGSELKRLVGHRRAVMHLAVSPDGRRIASSSVDRDVRLWDLRSGRPSAVLKGHGQAVRAVDWLPRSRHLITGALDGELRAWDSRYRRGRVLGRLPARIYALDVSPDGKRLAVATSDSQARIWQLEQLGNRLPRTRGEPRLLTLHRGEVNQVTFSRDGRLLATSSDDRTVRLWDAETGRPRWRAPALALDGDVARLLTQRGWRTLGGKRQSTAVEPTSRWERALFERGQRADLGARLLCWIDDRGQLELWDRASDRRLAARQLPSAARAQLAVGQASCAAIAGGRLLVLHREGTAAQPLLGRGEVTALTRDGAELIVAAGRDLLVLGDGKPRRLAALDAPATAIAATPDRLLIGYQDGRVELLERRATAKRRALLDPPLGEVTSLAEGPHRTVAAGYATGALALWDLRNGERLELTHLHGPVIHLARISPGVVAATELGDSQGVDLGVLGKGYCQVLADVWARVPVGWSLGQAVRRPPPADHRCARK